MDDETQIRRLIESWMLWLDTGRWEKLRSTWHRNGTMRATWFDGSADDFVANTKRGFENGINVMHVLGGTVVEIVGTRCLAQTRMSIVQRTELNGIEVDVICIGRFVDLISFEECAWKIWRRQLVYENDRVALVTPGSMPRFDGEKLAQFPEGYRHLAYIQSVSGYDVSTDLPGRTGPKLEAMMDAAEHWLGA